MKSNFSFKDLFFFKKLITPSVLTYIYWLSCIGIALFGLVSIFGSFALLGYYGFGTWITAFFTAILTTLVFFISTRIGFELLIIMFNINDNLKKIAQQKTTPTEVTIDETEQK